MNASCLKEAGSVSGAGADSRVHWVDIARGLGITLVVYGHVIKGIEGANLLNGLSFFGLSEYAIYTFHMPLFFVLAGMNVERSLTRGKTAFLLNKLRILGYPYLLWSLVQGLVQIILPSMVNDKRTVSTLLTILWKPIAQFWFLYSLLACHLIAWACGAQRRLLVLAGALAFAASQILPPSILLSTCSSLPFYVVGILSGALLVKRVEKKQTLITLIACVTAFAVTVHFVRVQHLDLRLVGVAPAIFGIAATISLSKLLEGWSKLSNPLSALGRESMPIYILHVFACAGTRAVLLRLGITATLTQIMLGVLAGIALPLIVTAILGKFRISSYVGLSGPEVSPRIATFKES